MTAARFALACFVATVAFATARADEMPAGVPDGYKLAYAPDFAKPQTINDYVFTDAKAWRLAGEAGGSVLELFGVSDYKPQFRSPFNIALLSGRAFTDVIIDAEVASTVKPYGHQDMCFVYGFVSPTQFYYTHIAVKPDPHAHNCFIVNGAERLAIAKETSDGVTWGQDQWHKVRIDRRGSDGSVTVYFDDLSKPIMRASDKTFPTGLIGLGSFDDKGKFRHVRVYAPTWTDRKAEPFPATKPAQK